MCINGLKLYLELPSSWEIKVGIWARLDHSVLHSQLYFFVLLFVVFIQFILWQHLCLIVGYTSDILDDAKAFSTHAGKKSIDVEDTKLAVQLKLDKSYTNPPPRELLLGTGIYSGYTYIYTGSVI